MEITVLGCGAAFPRAGGACSGFLVSSGDTHVWLDAGNGTFSRLQEHISYRDLDALVITHAHSDHLADVMPLMYALGFDPEQPPMRIPVYAPFDIEPTLLSPLGGKSKEIFTTVFDFRQITVPFEVGAIRFQPFPTKHPAESFGVRMSGPSDEGGKVAVYTSDTAVFPELVEACRDAELLVCEATWVDRITADPGVHMWAREAGRVAKEAGAKRLVLTHVWGTIDPAIAVAEASKEFPGPVEAAAEGNRYTL
jgi:ribonuclease BN (tRNA processing enzyme)